jgi:hypothetical protein
MFAIENMAVGQFAYSPAVSAGVFGVVFSKLAHYRKYAPAAMSQSWTTGRQLQRSLPA